MIGFIGLGNIGSAMAERLCDRHVDVTVFDTREEAMAPFRARARCAGSPADLGRHASQVGICVATDDQAVAALFGPDGLLLTLPTGGAVALHSTLRPSTVVVLAERAAARGVVLIDAAISGGDRAARQGSLTCIVGGEDRAVATLQPLLDSVASTIVRAGPAGAGMALKVANQIATYGSLLAALEAFRFGQALGVPHETLNELLTRTGALTRSAGLFHHAAAGPAGSDIARHTATLGDKDLGIALEIAREIGLSLPVTRDTRGNLMPVLQPEIADPRSA